MQSITDRVFLYHIYALSEEAITIELGSEIDYDTFARVNSLNKLITENPFPGFKTTLPAYATLTVFFDPMQVRLSPVLKGLSCFERIQHYLDDLSNKQASTSESDGETITIPVCYGGDFGPDLEFVAQHNQLSLEEVIKLHTEAVYKVYMLGFVPGFAYLGGLPQQLAMPRKPVPRKAVPSGSVSIAGMQTAVYPLQTPGGWQIIGRTPVKMFDVKADKPVLLKPGDQVVFKSISETEFDEIAGRGDESQDH
jgi:inhibitor of KinA